MKLILEYASFGGKHWETAAMKNMLAHHGVVAPHTGKPPTEALCLGIAGGIGVGYSFCPSIPRYDMQVGEKIAKGDIQSEDNETYNARLYSCGSGVSIVGRYRAYTTGGEYYGGFFDRLGAKFAIKESTGVKGAYNNLTEALEAGKPAIVWCAPMRNFFLGWSGTGGMYSMIVHGIDEEKQEAYIADRASSSLTISLEDLSWLRNKVCSHKNRLLTIDPPPKLTSESLKKAVNAGLKTCLDEMKSPKIKTFGLPGLLEWSKLVANPKNQKGWPKVYPGGRIFLPLRDVYDSIETAGNGGSLFRPLFADFLDEAADITGIDDLRSCAARYRNLGRQWSDLADTALSNRIKPFKRTKELLQKRTKLYEEKGQKATNQLEKGAAELREIELEMRKNFILDEKEVNDLLTALQDKIITLHQEESAAAQELNKAYDG